MLSLLPGGSTGYRSVSLLCCGSLCHLAKLDPSYASKLEANDWYRLRRALEICLVSGK